MIRCPECWHGFTSQGAREVHHCPFGIPLRVRLLARTVREWRYADRFIVGAVQG